MSLSHAQSVASYQQRLRSDGTEIRFEFRIGPSSCQEAGLGLLAVDSIPAARDVICKQQFLVVADNNHLPSTCDYCFMWLGSSFTRDNRMKSAGDPEPVLKRCGGCRAVWYCAYVRLFTPALLV